MEAVAGALRSSFQPYLLRTREQQPHSQECESRTCESVTPSLAASVELLSVTGGENTGDRGVPARCINDNNADRGDFDHNGRWGLRVLRRYSQKKLPTPDWLNW